jgi:hypothetical protein
MGHLVKRVALRGELNFGVSLLAHPRRPSLGYDGTNVTLQGSQISNDVYAYTQ